MLAVVFETVQVLVTLAAHLAAIWLLFLHANRTWVWDAGSGVHNAESAIGVLLELLVLVTML